MAGVDDMAEAALAGDAMRLRTVVQEWLRTRPVMAEVGPPVGEDMAQRVVAAGMVELFALRTGQPEPRWALDTGGLNESRYLVSSALRMKRLRAMCEAESPEPLRRRNLFAPADYLRFA